jgi:glycosyltransferase involved in cell wall biosynthesis
MNILYVSNMSYRPWTGPSYSVCSQISAQSNYDNVCWVNYSSLGRDAWKTEQYCYYEANFQTRLDSLPAPFQNPNLVIFECLYDLRPWFLLYDIWRRSIPYIVIPRSALTRQAQKKSYIKKVLGNSLFFKRLVKKATAIQYLSFSEFKESGTEWNTNALLIPNGIDEPSIKKNKFSGTQKKYVYIGRLEPYQKGLDCLIRAVAEVQDFMRKSGSTLRLYGSDVEKKAITVENEAKNLGIDDIVLFHSPIFGQEKESVLLDSDCYILTSRYEGMPMGLLEALSYGLPCIVTPGTNLSEEILEYGAGWVADGSVASIAEALMDSLVEDNMLGIGVASTRLAQRYRWDSIARKSHDEYQRIVGNK